MTEPERWVVLKLSEDNFKVYGTWSGGYLGSDRWKLNSGITKVEFDGDFYYFHGVSGSCYKCHKNSYGVANYFTSNVLEKMKEVAEVMDEETNWLKIIKDEKC